jgi:hypothetical protein
VIVKTCNHCSNGRVVAMIEVKAEIIAMVVVKADCCDETKDYYDCGQARAERGIQINLFSSAITNTMCG